MPWTHALLLVPAVALATAVSWAGLSVGDALPGWVPSRVHESVSLVAMGLPLVALGWGLDRLGLDRVPRRVALAFTPFLVLAAVLGAAMGWGWNASAGPVERAADVGSFVAIALLLSGFTGVVAVLGTGVGVWLSGIARANDSPDEDESFDEGAGLDG